MLSRVAENLYWIGRYIERTCNTARILDVNYYLSLDFDPEYVQWEPLIKVTGDHKLYLRLGKNFTFSEVTEFLIYDKDYINSAISTLSLARENVRRIREALPNEYWEEINTLYHDVKKFSFQEFHDRDHISTICRRILGLGLTLQGICEDSMRHGQEYYFLKIGIWQERADKTSRIIHAKYFYLLPTPKEVGTSIEDIHWMALLHSLNAIDIYQRQHNLISAERVIQFLILDPLFSRSIFFCLQQLELSLNKINGLQNLEDDDILNDINNTFNKLNSKEIIDLGLHQFINEFQIKMNGISENIQEKYFHLHHDTPYNTPQESNTQ